MFSPMLGLCLATIVLGLSPGPAVFATVGRALGTDMKSVYLFILGIILGDLAFSLIAMLGLAALAAAWTPLFVVLKIVGGGYLVYLGVMSLKRSKKPELKMEYKERGWKLVTSGFFLTASNPKDLLFFIGFLPAFVDLKHPQFMQMFVASWVIVFSFLATLSFYALAANGARRWFQNENSIRILHGVAGVLMICAGVFVIVF